MTKQEFYCDVTKCGAKSCASIVADHHLVLSRHYETIDLCDYHFKIYMACKRKDKKNENSPKLINKLIRGKLDEKEKE